jgi:hypothetical protein
MPARVRKLLSCVLPTPPVHGTVEHQQVRELFAGLADQDCALMMPHIWAGVDSKVPIKLSSVLLLTTDGCCRCSRDSS